MEVVVLRDVQYQSAVELDHQQHHHHLHIHHHHHRVTINFINLVNLYKVSKLFIKNELNCYKDVTRPGGHTYPKGS